MRRWWRPGAAVLLVLIVMAFFLGELGWPTSILFRPASPYSDLMLTHWPNAQLIRRSVWHDHTWPLWNPMQFAGVPFAANPLSGLWYPPNLLLLILPLAPAFNVLLLAHICLGGLGMMALCRRLGTGDGASLVAGLAWALTPKLWAHLGAGHVSLVHAAGWLPWIAAAAMRTTQSRSFADSIRLAFLWALQFLADPRLAVYTAGMVAAVVVWAAVRQPPARPPSGRAARAGASRGSATVPALTGRFLPAASPWIGAGLLGLGLTAVQWLPLLDYLPSTQRASLTVDQSAVYSLPPAQLLGLLYARTGGFHEWTIYAGVAVAVLAVLGWLALDRPARWSVASGLTFLVLFSLGEHTPLYGWVSHLPGATLLRVPPRVWFLVSFALAALAGLGAEELTSQRQGILSDYRRILNRLAAAGLAATGTMAIGLLFLEGAQQLEGSAWQTFIWLLLSVAACAVFARAQWSPRIADALLVVLVVAELAWADSSLVERRTADQLLADGWETGSTMADWGGRVYAPSFRPPPQVAAELGLRVVNGVEPLQPATYAAFLSAAAGVPDADEYSVTLPALNLVDGDGGADVSMALAHAEPSAWLLAVLDVRGVVSQFPMSAPQLKEVRRSEAESLIVYRNQATVDWPAVFQRVTDVSDLESALARLGTAALAEEAVAVGGRALGGPKGYTPAHELLSTSNRLVVRATGPGLLVFSEYYQPGWHASVDGSPAEIVAADAILRGIYLEDGEHLVEMTYRPTAAVAGMALSSLSLLSAAVVWLLIRRGGR